MAMNSSSFKQREDVATRDQATKGPQGEKKCNHREAQTLIG